VISFGMPAHGVTDVTVDGHPNPVTLIYGETVTIRCDVAKAGGRIQMWLTRDLGTGQWNDLLPHHLILSGTDGAGEDADSAPGRFAFRVATAVPPGRYIARVLDVSDNSTVVRSDWSSVPRTEAQAISGRVSLAATGAVPPDAVIWAYNDLQTPVAAGTIRSDGGYTLPLPPGSYLLFAEWFGRLRSQRQFVTLAAGQQVANVDLPLLQGEEVSGTVTSDTGQHMVGSLVQATSAGGQTLSTRTFPDGSFVLVLPSGQYTLAARGLARSVTVLDGPLDAVDFPLPAAGPDPDVGRIVTVAGNGRRDFGGDGGPATAAHLPNAQGVAVDAAGNLYIASSTDLPRVRRVDAKTGIITTVAGSGRIDTIREFTPLGNPAGFGGDDGPATAALLNNPSMVALDRAGNLYIADGRNHRIRKVDPNGVITTVAGSGPVGLENGGFAGDGGPAVEARLNVPLNVAVDAAGNLYIAERTRNKRVRKVDANGIITTVAGGGTQPLAEGAKAVEVALTGPFGLAVDTAGTLFIGESALNRVFKVTPDGTVHMVAGTGKPGFSGDDGPATEAEMAPAGGLALDRAGNLYLADPNNNRVRKISPDGIITTVVGSGPTGPGTGSFGGDGGPATETRLNLPFGLAIDAAGNLYIGDALNRRVRKVVGIAAPGLIGGQ
jgi:sugar lactone lactonase YvrE